MTETRPVFDHIGLWCTDLAVSAKRFESRFGVPAQAGGRHEGQGTWNRLVGAGSHAYLELIALDESQSARGAIARRASGLPDFTPCLIAYRTCGLSELADRARTAGCETPGPIAMQRDGADGHPISWEVLFITHPLHDMLPFFIDWKNTPHPSKTLGDGIRIGNIHLQTPRASELAALLRRLDIDLNIQPGTAPELHCTLEGPAGQHDL